VFFKTPSTAVALIALAAACLPAFPSQAADDDAKNPLGLLASGKLKDVDASADSYEYVGSNLIAKGHVVIRYQDMQILADKAIINISSKDVEAIGNVSFVKRKTITKTVDYLEYEDLLDDPTVKVQLERYVTLATGKQQIEVTVVSNDTFMKADRAVGNLNSGSMRFSKFAARTGMVYCNGAFAERAPDGTITVKDAKLTTCEYILDEHEHYSIHASSAVINPRSEANAGTTNYNSDQGEHSIWAYNTTFRVGDVPILWLPAMYKPPDSDSFGINTQFGHSSDYGYFMKASKKLQLIDDPNLKAKVMVDYYSKRGVGYGADVDFGFEDSKTNLFAYAINDEKPYASYDTDNGSNTASYESNNSRFKIPSYRYDLKLSNLTHLTPRMDFRGQIEKLSDINFLNDYFEDRYNENRQPPTFADLEYQLDRASLALTTYVKVNKFDTVSQRLPEFRFDVPRQELFSNVYYQGQSSASYLKQSWRTFDRARTQPNYIDPADYSTGRFDSLHMFYYPFAVDWLNVIPRAGFRLTGYSQTSKQSIGVDELNELYTADQIDGQTNANVTNYDNNGGAKLRLAGETGIEMNTKIYRSWQNVKNAFWEIDGMRHVAVPYVNYNFIPDPTVKNSHLMYFDDIDRIESENFVRTGVKNKLQTRRGALGKEQIYDWLSLENYSDFHFKRPSGYSPMGDIGNILNFNPFPDLSFTSSLILDPTQSDGHDGQADRGDRYAGRPGVSWKCIDRWYNQMRYQIAKDWLVYGGFNYQDSYKPMSTYSMGSTLTQINSTSDFQRYYNRNQTINGGFDFPLVPDHTIKGGVFADYDIDAAMMSKMGFKLSKTYHCWEVMVGAGITEHRDSDYSKAQAHYVNFSIGLTAMPNGKLGSRGSSGEGPSAQQ